MFKKGQVTIFIIISIFLVVAVILFFVLRDNDSKIKEIPQEISPFYTNLLLCLEQTSEEGIHYLAAHGGYYNVPVKSSIIYFLDEIPYYYLDNENIIPRVSVIERELEKYVSENLENCLDLKGFKEQGFNISVEPYSILTNIIEGEISVKMKNTITVSKGEDSATLKNTEISFKNDFINLYEASFEVVNSYSQKPGFICLTCLDDIVINYDVDIKSLPVNDISVIENNIIWYFITNKQDQAENKLKLIFVVEK